MTPDQSTVDSMLSRGHRVHMMGVCGIGMAGVAFLLQERGLSVSGCDVARNRQAGWLEANGVSVDVPHSPDHVADDVDWLIRSPAVPAGHAELVAAAERGIPIFRRGEVLPALLAGRVSIAVAGTHGKTTTATLTAQLLRGVGRDPSWCIGGESEPLGGVAGAGADGSIVVEADESDGTLALYHPDIAVVTNVEFDHMEHFSSEEEFEDCFRTFVAQTRKRVIYCADDPRAAKLCEGASGAVGYGFGEDAQLRGVANGDLLTISEGPRVLGAVRIPIPGRHNSLNAMAGIAVCLELGVAFDDIAAAMPGLGLPRRRFEIVEQHEGITVVSDYAHHPSEVAALIKMAREQHPGRLLAVFQPHRYTRTLALGADFPAAFEGVDSLILTPVYPASESPLAGGRVCDLYARFCETGSVKPLLARSLEQAWTYLQHELREGDMLLVIGAGDVEKIGGWSKFGNWESGKWKWGIPAPRAGVGCAHGAGDDARPTEKGDHPADSAHLVQDSAVHAGLCLSSASVVREREPLGRKTTYGVGGAADIWVEAGSVEDLAATLRWCHERNTPFRVLGAGSNVLVSDLGVRGIVARLTGEVFRGIRHESGEIVVGGAVPLAKLQSWLTGESLTGMEFLEGVPGYMGGIARMNGGAHGHEIRERVSWIRGLNQDGSECRVQGTALEWEYRGCTSAESMIVVEVGLRLEPGDPAAIQAERDRIAEKRSWMRGLRCSGSVFRNPPGQVAGRIIDELGLKGCRIGGARVSPAHGNFVVAGEGATASDVLALIEQVQAAVSDAAGVELATEVVLWE